MCRSQGVSAEPVLSELDCLNAQNLRQQRLVPPNLADHRLCCLALEEELDDSLSLGADEITSQSAADFQNRKAFSRERPFTPIQTLIEAAQRLEGANFDGNAGRGQHLVKAL